RDLLQRDEDRPRPGHQPRLLVQLGQRAPVEPQPEGAGHGVGKAGGRPDGAADRVDRHGRAEAAVRRGSEDIRRARANHLVRGAFGGGAKRDARRFAAAAALAARDGGRRPLIRYLARRLAFALALVLAVSSASFLLARAAPGDFFDPRLNPATLERQRARFGLDKPVAAHYRDWLASAARLDFGASMLYDRPVRGLVVCRGANTAR